MKYAIVRYNKSGKRQYCYSSSCHYTHAFCDKLEDAALFNTLKTAEKKVKEFYNMQVPGMTYSTIEVEFVEHNENKITYDKPTGYIIVFDNDSRKEYYNGAKTKSSTNYGERRLTSVIGKATVFNDYGTAINCLHTLIHKYVQDRMEFINEYISKYDQLKNYPVTESTTYDEIMKLAASHNIGFQLIFSQHYNDKTISNFATAVIKKV